MDEMRDIIAMNKVTENENFIDYRDCPILYRLKRKETPISTIVPVDEFTLSVQNNFDYEFTGESKFYPYEVNKELFDIDFSILAIVGASGSGKSTLLKELPNSYSSITKPFDNSKAIISNFSTPEEGSKKLSAVGLNSLPVWCRPRRVLSVGEGFRADIALNLESYKVFDEFTSTIDRNVAKSTCKGIQRYIRENNLNHIVFCSCHKDFIPFLKPDIVIDLDDEAIYDCRNKCLGKASLSKCGSQEIRTFGEFLGNIII